MTGQPDLLLLQPDVLRWARERAELTDDALANKVNLSVERVLEWERSGRISMAWAERLAHATHTPLGYLFLSFPPDEPLPIQDFRTRDATSPKQPSTDLLETVYAMQRRQDWMREEVIETGAEPLAFVGAYHPDGNYAAVAGAMRDALLLTDDWVSSARTWSDALQLLRNRAEDAGILVVFNGVVGNNTRRRLNPDEFQGFALVDEHAPLVFVNNADYQVTRMLTLAHELVHIFIGETGLCGFTDHRTKPNDIELFCKQTASEFLAHRADWSEEWDWNTVRASMTTPSRRYRIDAPRFGERSYIVHLLAHEPSRFPEAIDFDVTFESTTDDLSGAASEWSSRPREISNKDYFWNNQHWRIGRRFAETVIRAVRAGRLPYREAYALTGLSGNTFENMAERMSLRL